MFDLAAVQAALQQFNVDGWLLYDFRGSNVLARRVARISDGAMLTRRWFYFIPAAASRASFAPHRAARPRPPSRAASIYLRWQELEAGVGDLVAAPSPSPWSTCRATPTPTSRASTPAPSSWSAPSASRSCSSGDLSSCSRRAGTTSSGRMHLEAAKHTRPRYDVAFGFIAERVRSGRPVAETEVQQRSSTISAKHGLIDRSLRRSAPSARTAATRITSPSPAPTRRSARAISSSSTSGPSWTSRGPSTAT